MKSFLMTIVLPDKQHDEYDHMFPGGEEEDNVDNSRKKSLALRFYINHLKLLNIFSFLTSSSDFLMITLPLIPGKVQQLPQKAVT